MLIDRLGHWPLTYSGQRELRVKPKAAIKLLPLALIDIIIIIDLLEDETEVVR